MANIFDTIPAEEEKEGAGGTATATAEPEPAAEQPEAEVDVGAGLDVVGTAADVAMGLAGGARDALQNTIQGAVDLTPKTPELVRMGLEAAGIAKKDTDFAAPVRQALTIPDVAEQDTTAGHITRSISRFVLGFAAAGRTKVVKAVQGALGASRTAGFAGAAVQGAVGDFFVSDPFEARLADFLQDNVGLENAVTEYMAAEDSRAEGRFKAALEGVVIGTAIEPLMIGFRAMKLGRLFRSQGKEEEATKVLQGASDAIDESFSKASVKESDPVAELPPAIRKSVKKFQEAKEAIEATEAKIKAAGSPPREPLPGQGSALSPADEAAEAATGKAAAPKPAMPAKFIGTQEGSGDIPPTKLYNLAEDVVDPATGKVAHTAGSTVTENTLKKFGIAADDAPSLPKVKPLEKEAATQIRERIRLRRVAGADGDDAILDSSVLNYSKMDSANVVKQTLDDVAKIVQSEFKHIAGTYRSHEETAVLANMLGGRPEVLRARLAAIAKNADSFDATVVASKMWVQSQAREIAELAARVDNGLGGTIAEVELTRRVDILADMMDHLGAAQTGFARATSAGRVRTADVITTENVAKLLDQSTSEKVKQLAARVRMASTPKGIIASMAEPSKLAKAVAVHNFIWINSILSGFKTHFVNTVSNLYMTAIMPAQRIMGGTVDGLTKGNWNEVREGLYTYTALRHQIFDSFEMAKRSWLLDRQILNPKNTPLEITARPLSAEYLNIDKGQHSILAAGVDGLGKVVGMAGRFLNAEDEFFKQINYRSRVMAEAWREAAERGLDPAMTREYVETSMDHAIGDMGQALREKQLLSAQEATFTQSLHQESWLGGRTISEFIANGASHPIIKGTVVPFIKVPTNLFRTFLDTGPTALLRKQFYVDVAAGGERKAMALGKLGTGTMLWTGASLLALEGKITGAGPQDKDLQRQLRQNGWQPYSFVFENADGSKSYLSFAKLDPFAWFFGMAADFAEVSNKAPDSSMEKMALDMAVALAHSAANKSYLRGLIDVMSLLGGGYSKEEAARRWANYRIGSYIPSFLGALNPDQTLKETRSAMDAIRARTPGFSSFVESRRDNFGQKMVAPMGYPWSAVNPFTLTSSSGDTVREGLADLAQTFSEAKFPTVPEKVANGAIDLTTIRNDQGQSAYDRWAEMQGELKLGGLTLYESLDSLMSSDSYKDARAKMAFGDPIYKKSLAVDLVKSRFGLYQKVSFLKLQDEFPQLREALLDFKINSAKSTVQGPSAISPNPLISK